MSNVIQFPTEAERLNRGKRMISANLAGTRLPVFVAARLKSVDEKTEMGDFGTHYFVDARLFFTETEMKSHFPDLLAAYERRSKRSRRKGQ